MWRCNIRSAREFHFGLALGLGKARVSDWASALPWGRDESELLTELQAGSETAFDWLVTHYHAPVYNLILGMLGDASDAADGTQEVFLKAFRGIRGFRHGSSLKTWLYRIAIREALNHKRWFKRHLQKTVSIDAELEEGREHLEIEDLCATPFELLAAREMQLVVQRALLNVPHVFRVAVILRDLEGFSYEEVAEILECSIGTVKSRILRGRRALKEILQPLLAEQESHPGTEHGTPHSAPAKSANVTKRPHQSPFKDVYAAAWPVASVVNGVSLANNGEAPDEL
jgi:RNA polymerase sigma-70 factor (ECF subfamily)